MQVYSTISILCLGLMIIGLLSVIANFIRKNRAERIAYIRSFKKGKGAVIYLFAVPLYWIGNVYAGDSILDGFFNSVRRIVDLIVLKYDISSVQALVNANAIYRFTLYFCFILVCLNAILFVFSLVNQYLWNYFTNLMFRLSGKEKVLLFGNNEQNHLIYKSEKNRLKMVVDKITAKEANDLYMKNIRYTSVTSFDRYVSDAVARCVKRNKAGIAIINTGDDERNIELCRIFIKHIFTLEETQRMVCFNLLKIFVFGDPRYEAIYEDIISDSFGCVSYINKYQKIAVDFISKYPFTKFMTEEHIDYNSSLIKDGVEINTLLIGFGKTNQQIFLTSVANNQFITEVNGSIGIKKVRYHIFDKNPAENNKNLNHNYNRFKNESEGINTEDYLPLPDYPAEEFFYRLDVNARDFYNHIRKVTVATEKGVNFIVIAFGTDLENIDMAQKLVLKCREWGIKNIAIFVKVRGEHKGQNLLEEDNCYSIANEKEVVYDVEKILGDSIFKMAQMRNEVYDLEYELTQSDAQSLTEDRVVAIKEKAYRNWFVKKTQLERESSLYSCLSLRSKLNLMGLDYCLVHENDEPALTEKEYLEIYAQDDQPDLDFYKVKAEGKPIIHYSLNFQKSRRTNLAILEHLRWNSFMISKGMVPASKKLILEEMDSEGKFTNGKNYALRRHGNITTMSGLIEFRKMTALRDIDKYKSMEKAEESKDVIKYDYQLLDDAYWLLTKNGYKIVRL